MSAPAVLSVHGLRQEYDGRAVLDIPDFGLHGGRITGIAGPNGSGKSTFLRCLALLEKPVHGTLYMDGRALGGHDTPRNRSVTMLDQHPYLFRRKVLDNVTYGLRAKKFDGDLSARASEALEMVRLNPARFLTRPWYALSGGESQRVALAARLALRPRVLLLDEPTASLDQESTDAIRRAVLHARDEWNTAVAVVSHDTGWLDELCDEVHWLFRGRVAGTGRVNVLTGPWQGGAEAPGLRFSDGQVLQVSLPVPGTDTVAPRTNAAARQIPQEKSMAERHTTVPADAALLIDPEGLLLAPGRDFDGQVLDARLVQTLARNDATVFARFMVGDSGLWMRPEDASALPAAGLRVRLGVPSRAMRWIEA